VAIDDIKSQAEELADEARAVIGQYAPKLKELSEAMERHLEPIRKCMEEMEDEMRLQVEEAADDLMVDLPDRPEAEINPPDESDWLFDSTRSYGDQLHYYRAHKNGDT